MDTKGAIRDIMQFPSDVSFRLAFEQKLYRYSYPLFVKFILLYSNNNNNKKRKRNEGIQNVYI